MKRKAYIVLTEVEDQQADAVGKGRADANESARRSDRRSYDPTRIMSDNTLANQMAARCELGVAKFYGATWFGRVWAVADHHLHADEPDCERDGVGIEVKWRRTGGWGVPVDRKDAELNHLIVWASCSPATPGYATTITIHGERLASILWERARQDQRGDQRRRYAEATELDPPGTMFA